MLTAEISDLISKPSKGITLFITVGNSFRSDDGVGPYIAERIGLLLENTVILNAGDKPENIIDSAIEIKPARTIIIDAADFGGTPGEVRLIPEDLVPDNTLSTHTFPLRVITRVIAEDTGSEVFFLGIQPAGMALGEGLSEEVRKSADAIISALSYSDA